MGTWGPGSFDNDTAGDWLDELTERNSSRPIRIAIDAVMKSDYPDAEIAARAIAAAEVIACAKEKPTGEVPDELADWLVGIDVRLTKPLLANARLAVQKIQSQSELADLWKGADDWENAITLLANHLAEIQDSTSAASPKTTTKKKQATGKDGNKAIIRHLSRIHTTVYQSDIGDVIIISNTGTLTNAELEMMAPFAATLTQLSISFTSGITDQGLRAIGKLEKLEVLRLDALPKVTDQGIRSLPPMNSLRELTLRRNNQITSRVIPVLSQFPALEKLDLHLTSVADDAISGMLEHPALKSVGVEFTRVSEKGKAALREAGKVLI